MLTVKIIRPNGDEEVQEIERLNFSPRSGTLPPTLILMHPDGTSSSWEHGTFFVMNEAGHTITKYKLGDSESSYVHKMQAGAVAATQF